MIGCRPQTARGVDIAFTGIRPSERHEILFAREEPTAPVNIEIVAAEPAGRVARSGRAGSWRSSRVSREDRSVIFGVLRDAVPDFNGQAAESAA